jgi:malonyl CoA-acyl carrier protein transacylase
VSAVDEALAELKKAEELLAAAKAVDAAELPKAEVSTPADEPVSAPVAVAVAPVVSSSAPPVAAVAAVVTEAKRGPMIKNGKLYPSVR